MKHGVRITAAIVGLVAILLTPALAQATAKIEGSQTLKLNSHEKNISGYAGPIHTSRIMPTGKLYVAEVSGAISYYAKRQYRRPSGLWNTVCGEPEASPQGPLGIDAEFVFARPWTAPCPRKLPVRWDNFEISANNGGVYSHPAPLGGPFTVPTPGHHYNYPMVGAGKYGLFRLKDSPGGNPATADNYGRLTIHIRPAVAGDCAGTGWVVFGEPNEAACIAGT
jgi:hypothetical protein